jgi:hypothetical protein
MATVQLKKQKFKITIGTNTRFVTLDERYAESDISTLTGIEPAVAGDMKQGDYTEKIQALIDGGVLYKISVGLEAGKRTSIYFAADSVQKHPDLVDLSFGGKIIKSASPRKFTKLSA